MYIINNKHTHEIIETPSKRVFMRYVRAMASAGEPFAVSYSYEYQVVRHGLDGSERVVFQCHTMEHARQAVDSFSEDGAEYVIEECA